MSRLLQAAAGAIFRDTRLYRVITWPEVKTDRPPDDVIADVSKGGASAWRERGTFRWNSCPATFDFDLWPSTFDLDLRPRPSVFGLWPSVWITTSGSREFKDNVTDEVRGQCENACACQDADRTPRWRVNQSDRSWGGVDWHLALPTASAFIACK